MKQVQLLNDSRYTENSLCNPAIFDSIEERNQAITEYFEPLLSEEFPTIYENAVAFYIDEDGESQTIYEHYIDSGSSDYYYTSLTI